MGESMTQSRITKKKLSRSERLREASWQFGDALLSKGDIDSAIAHISLCGPYCPRMPMLNTTLQAPFFEGANR